jgi:hypothetical protein
MQVDLGQEGNGYQPTSPTPTILQHEVDDAMAKVEQGLNTKVSLRDDPDMMEITCEAKSNSCRQDGAFDIEMGYNDHQGVVKAFFVENNIAFLVEVRRTIIVEAIDKCSPSSPSKEEKILHVNMSTLRVDSKTIPKEGKMPGEKYEALQILEQMERAKENAKKIGKVGETMVLGDTNRIGEMVAPSDTCWAEEVGRAREMVTPRDTNQVKEVGKAMGILAPMDMGRVEEAKRATEMMVPKDTNEAKEVKNSMEVKGLKRMCYLRTHIRLGRRPRRRSKRLKGLKR